MISIWEQETFFAPQDVLIVGSGLVGLWSAFLLKRKQPDLKVTILERGMIPSGASTRNAGFACFGSLSELAYDARIMGTEKMLQLVEMRYEGLGRILKYFPAEKIDFELCGGYELYDEGADISSAALQENIGYLNSLLKPITHTRKTFALADEAIEAFGFGGTRHLVKNLLEGYLHSGKLVRLLLQTIQGMGVQVFSGVEVKGFEEDGSEVMVHTPLVSFRGRQLLLCTNAFTKQLLPDLDIVPARGQVLLTSPIPDLPWQGTFHSDEGFYYFRNLGDRVLLGGARNKAFGDEQTTAMVTTDFIQAHLERYLDQVILPRFRGQYSIEHRWAGIMGMGGEKMPIVKRLTPGISCAVRMSGMGVALAPVVARKVIRIIKEAL